MIAKTPEPPYYAVIFTSLRRPATLGEGYKSVADRMVELAEQQQGFLGVESVNDTETGITVSYWVSLEAIAQWRAHAEHRVARQLGRDEFYADYTVRIARVERDYSRVTQL